MTAYMILDLQFGSTGKGLFAGYLAQRWEPDVVVSAFGPNAGHTFIDADGTEYMHKMLPMGVLSNNIKHVLIGPGSVLDIDCFRMEVDEFIQKNPGHERFEIWIHPNTPILQNYHKEKEAEFVRIGSTMKGTAACAMDRMSRPTEHRIVASQYTSEGYWFSTRGIPFHLASHGQYRALLIAAKTLQIEGAQGHSLSIHGPFYPHCTARDVSYHQLMADCAIPSSITATVYGTARTYPIRVANRYDNEGKQIGSSGDFYLDQHEITWGSLGVEPELTTVTKLERRVFSFSELQIKEAADQNNVSAVFLNFCNYCSAAEISDIRKKLMKCGAPTHWLGFGPRVTDIREVTV